MGTQDTTRKNISDILSGKRIRLARLMGFASAGVLAFSLMANDAALADDVASEGGIGLEEVVVTARKREERLIDTPIAVTAVSADEINRRNLKDLSNISELVPNMVFDLGTGSTGSSNNAQIYIRGIGQQDFLFTSDPGVGLYIDGVYFPRGTGVVMDLVDLAQVEVLRGPQGTLFGKNTTGGAINISTKKPDGATSATIHATTGSRDRIDVQASLNLPLIENKLSMRLSGSSRNQDGYVERILVGDDLGDTNSLYGRLQLRWTPSDTLTVDLSTDVTRKREASVASELIDVRPEDPSNLLLGLWNFLVAPTYGAGVQMDRRYLSNPYETQATGPNFSDFDMFGVSLTIDKEVSDRFSIKSITSYREQDSQFADDTDHSPLRYIESNNDNDHEMFSQEIQFTGTSMDDRLSWVFGGLYMTEKGQDLFDVTLGGGLYDALEMLPAALIPLAPVACPPAPGDFLTPCAGGAGNPYNVALDLDILITDNIDIDSYAIFGEADFDLTDRLTLTAGLRYSHDKKVFSTSLLRKSAGIVTLPTTEVSDSWGRLSPRVILAYHVNDDTNVYGSVTGGYKSGGFNGRATSLAEIDSFKPEKVWAYELGMKTVFSEGRVGLNVAAFYNDFTDMQLLSVRDVGGLIVVVTENAGEVSMKGFEAELVASVADGFNLRGGIGYLDASYEKLAPTATVTLDHRPVKAPKWSANAAFDYTITMSHGGSVTLGGDVSYRSSYANELTNEPSLIQEGYALFGAYLRYMEPGERWSIALFGINLGDERYMTNGLTSFGSFGNAVANFAPPREWGLKVRGTF